MSHNLWRGWYALTLVLGILAYDGTCSVSEAQCTDPKAAQYSAPLSMGDVGGAVSSASLTTKYGSKLCPSYYVVEATQTDNKPHLLASAAWADSGLSQANCTQGHVSARFYGFIPATKSWEPIGTEQMASGVWTSSPFGGPGYCDVGAGLQIPPDRHYGKVRVAAKAYVTAGNGSHPKKVSGAISAYK